MLSHTSELMRVDPLTGCRNFLGFLETCLSLPVPDPLGNIPMGAEISEYSAMLFIDMNGIAYLNETKGRSHGDSAIRWMGILLGEETKSVVYRLGGDEFAVLLKMDSREQYAQLMERINERMILESKLLGFPGHPADVAIILYSQWPTTVDTMLIQMGEAMVRVKNCETSPIIIFSESDFKIPEEIPHQWKWAGESDVSYTVRWLSYKSISQVIEMGRNLDRAGPARIVNRSYFHFTKSKGGNAYSGTGTARRSYKS